MAEPRLSSSVRLQRLLAMLRYAAASPDGVHVDELCERFRLRRDQLIREVEMASLVGGDSAYFHDMPFEVYIDGDEVFCRLFALDKPLRLTPEEAFSLVVSADALVGDDEPVDSPLRSGLAKVAAVLGIDPEQMIDVDLDLLGGATGQLLDQAIAAQKVVRFRYWTYGTDDVKERRVDPWKIFQADGSWYLAGRDHDRDDVRRFRVDRMTDTEVLDDAADPPPKKVDAFLDVSSAATSVTIDLPRHARWVAESFPVQDLAESGDGRIRVTLRVAGRPWLERLLLRIGPDAKIVEIDEALGGPTVLQDVATRLLRRYRP